jgi:hypothetical protein
MGCTQTCASAQEIEGTSRAPLLYRAAPERIYPSRRENRQLKVLVHVLDEVVKQELLSVLALGFPLAPNQLCFGDNQIAQMFFPIFAVDVQFNSAGLYFHGNIKVLDPNLHAFSPLEGCVEG